MKLLFIIPLYRDWDSLEVLLPRIKMAAGYNWAESKIIIVDDFSLQPIPSYLNDYLGNIEIVELNRNLGHQKAIAIGLSYAYERYPEGESFVVLDSDGEDKPEDIPLLIDKNRDKNYNITFAHRQKRNEAKLFRTSYYLYKQFFRLLTGQKISFGNFCILSNNAVRRIIHVSEIWLHFSSGVIKSKIPYNVLPTTRGKRVIGNSKMNFTGLVNHGLSAIAVYSEIVAVRITLISIFLSLLSLAIIVVLFLIKQFTSLAIPGWTSFVTLGFLILITQFFSLGILLAFVVLSSKTIKNINPSLVFKDYIFKVHLS